MGCCLTVVRIEAAELDVENLAIDAEAGASTDNTGDGLEGGGERVIDEHISGRVEILRRVGNAGGTGREHRGSEQRLGLDRTVDDDFVFLGESWSRRRKGWTRGQ